jgi:hypothetical protein
MSREALFIDRLSLSTGHISGVAFEPHLTNLVHAGGAVGAKDKSEYLSNPIIKHAAVAGILKILAVGARCKLVANAACPHLAPRSLVIFPASRTPAA